MSKSENCTKILNLNQLLNEWIQINVNYLCVLYLLIVRFRDSYKWNLVHILNLLNHSYIISIAKKKKKRKQTVKYCHLFCHIARNYKKMTVRILYRSDEVWMENKIWKYECRFYCLWCDSIFSGDVNGEEWSSVRKRLYKTNCRNDLVAGKGRFKIFETNLYDDVALHKKKKEWVNIRA